MPAKNTIKVLIGGKIITLSGYESEEYLQNVASYTQTELLACLIMQSFTVWKHYIQHSTIYSTRVS